VRLSPISEDMGSQNWQAAETAVVSKMEKKPSC